MSFSGRVAWETMRTIDSATFTGSYQALGTPLANPAYKVKMVNNSTVDVTVTTDGINAHDIAPAGSFWLYDEGLVGQSGSLPALPQGTQISVKGSAGTGTVYLVVQYIQR